MKSEGRNNEKIMKILSIGNSFSQDAQRYLHRIAKADGVNMRTVNLYIGGCSLGTHFRNMLSGKEVYELGVNGSSTGFWVSIEKALLSQEWDCITLQQASHLSNDYETYQPYLNELVAYVKKLCPKAKIFIHETWAYEQDSKKLNEQMGYTNAVDMYRDVHNAYASAVADIQADGIIPSGTLFQKILDAGIPKIHRDTFHATLGLGRYALGLLWYKTLTGNSVMNNAFCDFDEEVSEEEMAIVKKMCRELGRKKKNHFRFYKTRNFSCVNNF